MSNNMEIARSSFVGDANLKAYYKLEDANDYFGVNNLTNNNSVTFTAAKYNLGANFGASNSNKYLSLASNLGITGGSITMCGWVQLQSEIAANDWTFLVQSDATSFVTNRIEYYYNSGAQYLSYERVRQNVSNDAGTYSIALGATNIYHLAMTYDGTNVNGFLNGNLVAGPVLSSGNGVTPNSSYFDIGAGNAAFYSSSLMDDVAVFNRALSAAEIARIYRESQAVIGKYW